ncbi:RidA family protein [Clostridiaceae bacterium Marseille-Q4143]|nr:RidA family protein [Clostridiaceae bacterium Marseille-Q4143]
MNKVFTESAPAAIGPYSQAIVNNDLVYTSGQIPINPKTNEIPGDSITQQTKQVIDNLNAVLTAAGSSLDKVIKTTCYLSDMSLFSEFNQVYEEYFIGKPARSCVAVKTLPKNVMVEIDAVAYL